MPSKLSKFRNWKVLVPTILLAVVVVVAVAVLFGLGVGPCHDGSSFQGPDAVFAISYQAESEDVSIRYNWGDNLTEAWTFDLYVTIRDAESGETSTYPLATASEDFPVRPGQEYTLENVSAGGNPITDGDRIRVNWYGREKPLPSFCLSSRGNKTLRYPLSEKRIGE